jgi:radical SAM superfamily enzyme YgiQ (UPF0313 family)
LDILLISAPVKQKSRHAELAPPLGLLYMATVLRAAGYVTKVIDLNLERADLTQVRSVLEQGRPGIIGISTLTETYPAALVIADLAKQINPAIQVVMGGAHPSVLPREVASDHRVDFVVRGEGEYTLWELAEYILRHTGSLDKIAGIVYRQGDEVIVNPEREFIKDPDELPFPERRLLPLTEYECRATILASRGGCPYSCRYCAVNNIWKGKRRFRQPELVVQEMVHIIRDSISSEIVFVDDIFTLSKRYILDLCQAIKSVGRLNCEWRCTTRADLVDKELLYEMRKVGCTGITFGVEAGSQKILEIMDKRLTLAQVQLAVNLAQEAGMRVTCAFMFPHPEDTEETVREQMHFMKTLTDQEVQVSLSYTTPLPGTYYYEHANDLGIKLLVNQWDEFDMNHLQFSNRYLSLEKLAQLDQELFQHVGLDKTSYV